MKYPDGSAQKNKQIHKTIIGVNKIAAVLREGKSASETFSQITALFPAIFEEPNLISCKITMDHVFFESNDFFENDIFLSETFPIYDQNNCVITVYKKAPYLHFTAQEKALFGSVIRLIKGFYRPQQEPDEMDMSTEQLKELAAINRVSRIFREKKPLIETFEQICSVLPRAWQHPRHARAKITFGSRVFYSDRFVETGWRLSEEFKTIDNRRGMIEIFYLKELPIVNNETSFSAQETHLLHHVAKMITSYLNGMDVKEIENQTERKKSDSNFLIFNSRQLLQRSLNNQNYGREIFQDLMPFKVREILLIANLYDVFSMENEGRSSTHLLREFYEFGMSEVPRITGVSTKDDAMQWLQAKHFDIVVIMMGLDKTFHIDISKEIREKFPYMPMYMLLKNNSDLVRFEQESHTAESINKVYVWNGDSKIFFAMIKNLEDRANVENDTKVGQVRVMLLVEDSPQYYSRYMPTLYSIIMEQTHHLLDKADRSPMEKVLRLRARPKILHATNYEDAMYMYYKYRENLLCVISDVRFWREGILDETVGFRLVEQIRRQNKYLPIIMQSSDDSNKEYAHHLDTAFIHKQSETLIQDIKDFISSYLGFGDFVFKDESESVIKIATTIVEFEEALKEIPDSSLLYHARHNHFSLWFLARGEVQLARIIQPYRLEDFTEPNAIRNFLIDSIIRHRSEQAKGKVIPFEEIERYDNRNIASMYPGSFGGKGRGLAFANNLIYNIDFERYIPDINIAMPHTFVIGTDAFEDFLIENKLTALYAKEMSDEKIKKIFIKAKLPLALRKKIRKLAEIIDKPLAVRSSGLFEDSLIKPFTGIFETYLIPFNHSNPEERAKQCENAVKMVYASVFERTAKDYIRAVNYKIEEEQMAVVIQEVVGHQYDQYYYPHISGVAQSYNYYPVGHCKPEDGFAVLGVGLGCYVVGGERTFRFCPKYPNIEISSVEDQIKASQNYFYAVDLGKTSVNLTEGEESGLQKLSIDEAEKHRTIIHTASTYDYNNGVLRPGIDTPGIRIVNFANILKYNYIPLSKAIMTLLGIIKEAMGSPVEIEFAVDLNKDEKGNTTFYLLQIKPLLSSTLDCTIDLETLNKERLLLYAEKGMGNGIIDDITDVVVVDPETFDKTDTLAIANEVDAINRAMIAENRRYVLIGPGRWGTRDRFIGIPVTWPQISNAKIIVETSLEGFPLDGSYGSHFFHNITAMNIGYYSVQHFSQENFINWNILRQQPIVTTTKYCKNFRFKKPFTIKMDGKQQLGVIEE